MSGGEQLAQYGPFSQARNRQIASHDFKIISAVVAKCAKCDMIDNYFPRKKRYTASIKVAHEITKYFGKTIEEVFIFED